MEASWQPAHRALFRFAVVYTLLYTLPGVIDLLPGLGWLSELHSTSWDSFISGVARVLSIDLPPSIEGNGSGDTSAAYLSMGCQVGLAVIGAVVWSIADRRRTAYPTLLELLRTYLRYVLAMTMLWYGFAKIFKSQFPFPSPGRMLEPIGDASPMGLLWTFMGYSTAYTIFAGAAEALGAVLLLFRRTTTLGALVLTVVLGHVVLLNFAYDVPVKLYSSQLLIMSLFLLAPQARRLTDVLLLNRPTQPADLGRFPVPPRWRRVAIALKVVLVAAMAIYALHGTWDGYRTFGDGAPRGPLYGAYDVLEQARSKAGAGGEAEGPIADVDRWRSVGVSTLGLTIYTMDGVVHRYRMTYDEKVGSLELVAAPPDEATHHLQVRREGPDVLDVEGEMDGHHMRARLRQREPFLLESRGFHWINEFPFNR